MDRSIVRMVFLFLLMSALIPLISTSPAEAQVSRYLHFERAADALELWGDKQGAANLRRLGHNAATVPPELSANARSSFLRYPEYVASYDQYRRRVRQAILQPVHDEADQWRIDRAEAALHLVAYEMEQGIGRGGGSMPLIRHFLYDAWWSLNHHIAIELIAAPIAMPTADIGVSPDRITRGEEAVLTWNTTNATTAEINGERVSLSGNKNVSPTSTTTFELQATGAGGSAMDRTTLAVIAPPAIPTASISVSPEEIERGRLATLSWSTSNAKKAEINGEEVSLNGQRSVSPATTSVYDLVATGDGGRATDRTVLKVRPPPAPTADISVNPESIERGSSAQLVWSTTNATRAMVDGEVVGLSGTRTVMPNTTQVYQLEATGDGGQATDKAVLIVTAPPAPTAELNVRPNRITEGDCATLNWATRSATRATINGEVVDVNGEMRVCPTETITYELLATGPGGRATDREIVTVTVPPVTHYRVHFDFDEAFIREDAKDTMAKVAGMMRESPGLQMRIEGHCDWKGSDAYNMALGMRRAESARDYFVNIYGISPTRFTLVSYGESRPIAENVLPDGRDNPEGRQMNRRAVFEPVR